MTSSFHDDSLQEQSFRLLYGLLTEKEAEEFRSFLTTDSEAAQVFEAVRRRVDMIVEFCSVPSHSESIVETGERNVSLEPPSSDPFAFDAAVGAFESGVFADEARENKTTAVFADLETKTSSSSRRKKNKKHSEKSSTQTGQNIGKKDARDLVCDNLREGGSALSKAFGLYLKRLGRLIRTSPLFFSILTLLIFFGGIIISGAWLHERELSHYFQDDFRVQVAAPRFLVKDAVQTIVVKTTGVDGRPRRIPIRFTFIDPTSNAVLSTHIEGGNSGGSILYELSDLTNFPERVLFTVTAEGMDSELFKAELLTLESDNIRQDSVADWLARSESIISGGNGYTSKIINLAYDDLVSQIDSENTSTGSDSNPALDSSTKVEEDQFKSIKLSFFPEMGKFVGSFSNHVAVFASDDEGRPISCKFLLFRDGEDNPIASWITNERGVGNFDFAPRDGEKYWAAVVSNKNDFEDHNWKLPQFLEKTSDVMSSFDDFSLKFDVDPSDGVGAMCFKPSVVTEKLYFSLNERVLSASDSPVMRISSLVRLPLLVVIEKSGVNVMQSFITSSGERRECTFALPERLAGLMTLKLFTIGQGGVRILGEIPFWRFPFEDDTQVAPVDVVKGKYTETVFSSQNPTANFPDDSQQHRLCAYWSQNVRDAVASLGIDEFLGLLDVSERNSILQTMQTQPQTELPVVFDNLETLRERTRLKLEQFNKNETKVFLWLIRLGVAGCYVTLLGVLFLSVFRAFTFGRGATLLGIICILLLYSIRALSLLDYVDVSTSHDVVFTTQVKASHEKNEDVDKEGSLLNNNRRRYSSVATSSKRPEAHTSFKHLADFPLNENDVKLNLENYLSAEEIDSGVLVLKYCCKKPKGEKTTVRIRWVLGENYSEDEQRAALP